MTNDSIASTTPNIPISQDTTVSEPVTLLHSEPQAPRNEDTPSAVNYTTPENSENKAKIEGIGINTENAFENQAIPEPEENPQSPVTPTAQIGGTEPLPEQLNIPVVVSSVNPIRELLSKARNAIQSRKRKKLDRILNMFTNKSKIPNDEVEKLLHVSDATATRYLEILEKENKIKQSGKTGKAVSYSKI